MMEKVQRDCRSCGMPVLWLAHEKSRRLAPIDLVPVVDGNVHININRQVYSIVGKNRRVPGDMGHTNHFATCPSADSHRG